MAFMGRGSMPSLGSNNIGGDNNNLSGHGYHGTPYFFRRFCYYIPLDNTYVIMQMIVTFIILIRPLFWILLCKKHSYRLLAYRSAYTVPSYFLLNLI